jgi:putative SOS response-associated peptidase YedK
VCGRISLKTPARVLAEIFGVDVPPDLTPRYNIAPTQPTLIIRGGAVGREASWARWGYIPPWRGAGEKGPEPINARSETAPTSRLFAEALRARRCVVPASGFYEWRAAGRGVKRPYHIEPLGAEVFALAGLWSRWSAGDGGAVESFAILTCAPNRVVKPIHDRMPVILPLDALDAWLDPSIDDAGTVAAMLRPAPDSSMVAREVTGHVNNPRHDDERCIRPVEAAPVTDA